MAFGTSTAQSVNHPHHDDRQDDEQRQNRQNLPSRKFIVGCRNLGKRFAALFQDHSHSIDTLRHAAIEIVLPKGRQHELHLNPFADRIGQNALQSTAGNEAYFMPILDQQNAQTIIVAGISDTPTPEQFDGKRKSVATLDIIDCHDGDLRQSFRTQCGANLVNAADSTLRKYAVGIAHIPVPVAKLHIGHLVGTIRSGRSR